MKSLSCFFVQGMYSAVFEIRSTAFRIIVELRIAEGECWEVSAQQLLNRSALTDQIESKLLLLAATLMNFDATLSCSHFSPHL